jgi:hypothetical protein
VNRGKAEIWGAGGRGREREEWEKRTQHLQHPRRLDDLPRDQSEHGTRCRGAKTVPGKPGIPR